MNYTIKIYLFLFLIFNTFIAEGINTLSAYIEKYTQKTEIKTTENGLKVITSYDIIFKFNDEKAVTIYNNYAIYYSSFETLEDLEVYTKNPQPNGKIKTIEINDFKTTNAKNNSIFFDDEKEIKFGFLGITVGSEARVKYTVSTEEAHFTEPMTFSSYLPILERSYELTVPKQVRISILEKNILPTTFQFSKEEKKNETIYTWLAKNIEEDKPMDALPARMAYTPHVLYKINDYTLNGIKKTVADSPKDLFDWYVDKIKHVNTKPSERISLLADSITKEAKTDKEKVKLVYNWVKQNIRYVAFENGMEGLIPREGELVCNRKYGDCKDMSSLQYALLKSLKVPAYLTWIGTRRIPYTYEEVPMKNTDNHMIAAAKLDGAWYFLDATDPNGIFGIPPDHIQGKQAMIYKSDSEYELVTVPVVDASRNVFSETNHLEIIENNLHVQTASKYTGLLAGNLANGILYLSENDKEEYGKSLIKGISNNAVLKKFNIIDTKDDNEVKYTLDFQINDYAKKVDDELYINLLLDKTFNNLLIKEQNRSVPYEFKFNSQHELEYHLIIPDAYKVEYLPSDFKATQLKEYGGEITYKVEGKEIVCRQKVYVNVPDLWLKPNQFVDWNKFINTLNKSYKESIILKKK